MKRILLASHGRLADGLKDTLEFFLGKTDSLTAVCAYVDETDAYLQELKHFVKTAEEGKAVIFTDIRGGSVNQQVTALVAESGKNIPIVSSMNLPVVLSIMLAEEELTADLIKEKLVECTPELIDMFENMPKEGDADDFFR